MGSKISQEYGDQMEVFITIVIAIAAAVMFVLNQFKE